MDHLAQDLSVALEESESCGPATMQVAARRWGMRRRTRSTGNLHLCLDKYLENKSDDSSSGEMDNRGIEIFRKEYISNVRHSDSDDMSLIPSNLCPNKSTSNSIMRDHVQSILTLQRHNARPSIRRKRKLKRMCVDEVPVLPSGKRKRPQRIEPMITSISNGNIYPKIKPLNQSIVDKIEKIRMENACLTTTAGSFSTSPMESSFLDLNVCDAASESSLSWSGDEGHEGDDELTDWTPQPDPIPNTTNELWNLEATDSREIRAGCRRLYNERPGFSITSGANERIARFMQDGGRTELRLFEGERDALAQLANLYSLDWWEEGHSVVLKKTGRTPCMQPPQRHHTGLSTGHKRIRTHETRPL
ncbi:G patch domain-containing protein 2 [Chrysoperla carnea]|uniref:G patch domain-containing protein 2 n=1 Tax=Chrysoperla carnea TaxID=189513 RepID=UPI001D0701B2|nr:G patch domain-containing protein 2 [Chrysoperla carnea]